MSSDDSSKTFSRNAVVNAARRSGVKCISKEAIDKMRDLLHLKVDELATRMTTFYCGKNKKTVTRKTVINFLESDNTYITGGKDI
jgi:hypothetical protein